MGIGTALDEAGSKDFLQVFKQRGYTELDTAYLYGGGQTEVILGNLGCHKEFNLATKANPWFEGEDLPLSFTPVNGLEPEKLEAQLNICLKRLQTDSVDLFYLHAPDHKTPIEQTLERVDQLHKQGKFKRFGVSNYAAWQVAQICEICRTKGWIMPTVYQGMYNALCRDIERELIPCLRNYNISFYAYNPLAGGILTGKHQFSDDPDSGRFTNQTFWGQAYRARFWKKELFEGISAIKQVCDSHSISMTHAALRWMYHHGCLDGEKGDGVILGGSSITHLNDNLDGVEAGPLPEDIVNQFSSVYDTLTGCIPQYFR